MNKYLPKMYKKNIYEVNYDKLKDNNIKCLMFDLDNTLLKVNKSIPKKETIDLIKKLKKDFTVLIISNNSGKKRLEVAANHLGIDYVRFALKPLSIGFRKIKNKYKFEKKEMCLIGDQIMTDILGGNRYGVYTVLVDPLSKEELKVTGVNRFFEQKKVKKLEKKKLFKKGDYYE